MSGNTQGTLGIVGLGAMGLPIALKLLRAGHHVQGFDLKPAALAARTEGGGLAAGTAAAAAEEADALILVVFNAAQAHAVLLDAGGLAALPDDATLVLMATCPPAEVAVMAERPRPRDGTRSTHRSRAESQVPRRARLPSWPQPPPQALAPVRPVLDVLGGKIIHVGEAPGQGAVVKSVKPAPVRRAHRCHGGALALAGSMGIDPAVMLAIVSGSAAASRILRDRGTRMLQDHPAVSSAVDIFVKDLGIVMEAGRDARAALPLAALVHQLFLAASGQGHGKAEDSQLIRTYHQLNGKA